MYYNLTLEEVITTFSTDERAVQTYLWTIDLFMSWNRCLELISKGDRLPQNAVLAHTPASIALIYLHHKFNKKKQHVSYIVTCFGRTSKHRLILQYLLYFEHLLIFHRKQPKIIWVHPYKNPSFEIKKCLENSMFLYLFVSRILNPE